MSVASSLGIRFLTKRERVFLISSPVRLTLIKIQLALYSFCQLPDVPKGYVFGEIYLSQREISFIDEDILTELICNFLSLTMCVYGCLSNRQLAQVITDVLCLVAVFEKYLVLVVQLFFVSPASYQLS